MMTQQGAINEIGRLNRVIDDLRKDKAALHQDVTAQREAMALASIKLEHGNITGAIETLNREIGEYEAQREPRKAKS